MTCLLGPSGCGQDHADAHDRRPGAPDEGRILFGERDVTRLPPRKRKRRHGVPVSGHVPDADRRPEHPAAARQRPQPERGGAPAAAGGGARRPADGRPGRRDDLRPRRGQPAEGGGRPLGRAACPGRAVRRADHQCRGQCQAAAHPRVQGGHPAPQADHRLRHPRPDRGDDPGRQHRPDEGRPDRPERAAAGPLRPAEQPVSAAGSSAIRA